MAFAPRGAGISRFGGQCFGVALAMREAMGRGTVVLALNAVLWDRGREAVGHAALEVDGVFLDGEVQAKTWEEIESWRMLDVSDGDLSRHRPPACPPRTRRGER